MKVPTIVAKVGGSLLELPDLDDRLSNWLDQQPAVHYVLIVGGGQLVEQVRQWDSHWPLDTEVAHWLCVDLMSVNSRLLHSRLPDVPWIDDDRALIARLGEEGVTLLDAANWLRESEPRLQGTRLPANWEVTSDAIAGRLAVALQAEQLVLLKSALPEQLTGKGLGELADEGMIDAMLSRLAAELPPVRMVDMRANPHSEAIIQTLEPPDGLL